MLTKQRLQEMVHYHVMCMSMVIKSIIMVIEMVGGGGWY